jgi:hypothetical protein
MYASSGQWNLGHLDSNGKTVFVYWFIATKHYHYCPLPNL